MKNVARFLLGCVAVVAAVVFAFAGTQWLRLARLPFNAQGRFFDAREDVVYERDGLLGWGLVAVPALGVAGGAALLAQRLRRGPAEPRWGS